MNRLLPLVLFFLVGISVSAQLKSINYKLKFNKETELYDCYLVVNEGSAVSSKERIQFNSQICIVSPEGSVIRITENHMPLQDNEDLNGKLPMKWTVGNELRSIQALNGSNVTGIIPSLSPTAFYNKLEKGNEVKLFSFKVSPLPWCGEGVRLFDNGKDPSSSQADMLGGDFSNAITIGNLKPIYNNNSQTENSAYPSGLLNENISVVEDKMLKLDAGSWDNASSFEWSGPFGFTSTNKNPIINIAKLHHKGTYTLKVKSSDGCTTEKKINVNVQPVNMEDLVSATQYIEGDANQLGNRKNANGELSSSIFPNPVYNTLNLNIENGKGQKIDASIYTIDGKLLNEKIIDETAVEQNFRVSIPLKIKSGVYLLKVKIGEQLHEHKFIVME